MSGFIIVVVVPILTKLLTMTSPFLGPAATPLMMPAQSPYILPSALPSFYAAPTPEYGQPPYKTPLMAPATPAFYAAASPQVTYQTIQAPIQYTQHPQQIMQHQYQPSTIQTVMRPHTTVQMIPRAPDGPRPDYVVQKHQPIVHSL
jgi:hypothetical protein